jgi:hypothetical protein
MSTITVSLIACAVWADQYEFEQIPVAQQQAATGISAPITVNRQFQSINAVVVKLQSLGFFSSVSAVNENEITNQTINVDATVKDFIYAAAAKFGYSAVINQNQVTFKGLYLPKPKPTPSPKPVVVSPPVAPTVAVGSNLAPAKPAIVVTNNWAYSPNDKYISATLNRWAKQANYQLVWQTSNDFGVQSSGSLGGSFKSAVNVVLKSFRYSEHPLKAQWYQNNVVVITDFNN